jgi:hypothetical protein
MIEIGIGVLFAVLFVTAYLLVSKLLRSQEPSRWREIASHPLNRQKQVAGKPSPLFLKASELSDRHSKKQ